MLSAQDTACLLPYPELLAALRVAALDLAAGRIACPPRQVIPMGDGGTLLSMGAVADDIAVHKLVTVVPQNAQRGLPTVQSLVSVLSSPTGAPLLTLEGSTVTGRRTAALSMLGVVTLLEGAPLCLRLYGTGAQAHHHVQALAALYPGARLEVIGRTLSAAENFCAANAQDHAVLVPAEPGSRSGDADVIITCTTSREPIYSEAARAGRLIVAVGTFSPTAAEIAAATVRASVVYVDDPLNARQEAGDLVCAGVDWAQVRPLSQQLAGGERPRAAMLFKTVGSAAWDLAAARVALQTRAVTELSHSAANVTPPSGCAPS